MKKTILAAFLVFAAALFGFAYGDKTISIWDGIKIDLPSGRPVNMYLFNTDKSAENALTPAVIILPGGSYHHHGMNNEGKSVAKWFNSKGFTAFVLRYRISAAGYKYPDMMRDLQRAIQLVRENADKYKIDPDSLGLIGFSAGGHLAAWQAEYCNRLNLLSDVEINTKVSLEPDWICSVYPVVSMQDDIYHAWSRWSLLRTKKPTQEQKDMLSLELQVPDKMPPVYLVACHDDHVVKFENSQRLYNAIKEKGHDITFAEYEKGGHGFGMNNNKFMKRTHWNEDLYSWLEQRGFTK